MPQRDMQTGNTAQEIGKTGKEIEELTGVRQNRASEIWAAYQRGGEASLEREKYRRKPRSHMVLTLEEQEDIRKAISEAVPQSHKRANAAGLHEALRNEPPAPGEAHAETESYRHLEVEKGGICCYFKACESRGRSHLSGGRGWCKQL